MASPSPWQVRAVHGNCSPASISEGQLYRRSALCAFSCALSRRNPREGSACGQCCHGGSLPGTAQDRVGEGGLALQPPESFWGISSHSLSDVSLRAEVAKVEGKWIYCPHGPRAAHHRSVAGLPWGFDWSVQGDAL